jgi:uridine kinase
MACKRDLPSHPPHPTQVFTAHPKVKVVTSEVDSRVDEHFRVVPGVGEFGDRYFCE